MKIYTKTGDKGKTSLLGGSRVAKDHLRIEAYGTVDELNAWVGHIRSLKSSAVKDGFLVQIQSNLFAIGSALAAEKKDLSFPLPELPEESVEQLELAIDRMNEKLPELRNFVLPGGEESVSRTHLARTVCRRAERRVAALSMEDERAEAALVYLNRLSDYFFALSRYMSEQLGHEETKWNP